MPASLFSAAHQYVFCLGMSYACSSLAKLNFYCLAAAASQRQHSVLLSTHRALIPAATGGRSSPASSFLLQTLLVSPTQLVKTCLMHTLMLQTSIVLTITAFNAGILCQFVGCCGSHGTIHYYVQQVIPIAVAVGWVAVVNTGIRPWYASTEGLDLLARAFEQSALSLQNSYDSFVKVSLVCSVLSKMLMCIGRKMHSQSRAVACSALYRHAAAACSCSLLQDALAETSNGQVVGCAA